MTRKRDRAVVKARHPRDYGAVVGVAPIAVQLEKIGEETFDVIEGLRTIRLAREAHPFKRRQPRRGALVVARLQRTRRRSFIHDWPPPHRLPRSARSGPARDQTRRADRAR